MENTEKIDSSENVPETPVVSCDFEVTLLYYKNMCRPLMAKSKRGGVICLALGAFLTTLWVVSLFLNPQSYFLWLGIIELLFGALILYTANNVYKTRYGQFVATNSDPLQHVDFYENRFVRSDRFSYETLFYESVTKWSENAEFFYLYFGLEQYQKAVTFPKWGFASPDDVNTLRNFLSFRLRGKEYRPM